MIILGIIYIYISPKYELSVLHIKGNDRILMVFLSIFFVFMLFWLQIAILDQETVDLSFFPSKIGNFLYFFLSRQNVILFPHLCIWKWETQASTSMTKFEI